MRLVTVAVTEGTSAAVMVGSEVALVRGPGDRPAYPDVGALLRAGVEGEALARWALDRGASEPVAPDALRRPVLAPEAILCVGLNYRSHIAEMGRELPTSPTLFTKLARALTDPFADIALPPVSRQADYEGELAVVIGAGGRDIPAEAAIDAVAGFTVLNDVTMRDLQRRTVQWFAGKSLEASTPVGPAIVTPDEVASPSELRLAVAVNGEQRQSATLSDLVFDVPRLVSELSSLFALRPGDIIATGTPGGVGAAMEPPSYLEDGDVVEVEITGLGTLRSRFTREPHAR